MRQFVKNKTRIFKILSILAVSPASHPGWGLAHCACVSLLWMLCLLDPERGGEWKREEITRSSPMSSLHTDLESAVTSFFGAIIPAKDPSFISSKTPQAFC